MQQLPLSPNRSRRRAVSKASINFDSDASVFVKINALEDAKRRNVSLDLLSEVYSRILSMGPSYSFRRFKKHLFSSAEEPIVIFPATDYLTPPRLSPLVEAVYEKVSGQLIIHLRHAPSRTVLLSLVPELNSSTLENAHRIYRNGSLVSRVHKLCGDCGTLTGCLHGFSAFGLYVSRCDIPDLERVVGFTGSPANKISRTLPGSQARCRSSFRFGSEAYPCHVSPRPWLPRPRVIRSLLRRLRPNKDPLLPNLDLDHSLDKDSPVGSGACSFEADSQHPPAPTLPDNSLHRINDGSAFERIPLRAEIFPPAKNDGVPTISFCILKANGEKSHEIAKFGKGFGSYVTRNELRLVLTLDCIVDPLCLILLSLHVATQCNFHV